MVTIDTMAYLVRRSADRWEIRESQATAKGPRSRTLAGFTGPLTDQVLRRAEARARRPLDPARLVRRARALGLRVVERSREPEARALLARLHRDEPLDPATTAALRAALARRPEQPVPDPLADVVEWVGASPAARGQTLRELLDLYGLIAESRPPLRRHEREPFPRFSSLPKAS